MRAPGSFLVLSVLETLGLLHNGIRRRGCANEHVTACEQPEMAAPALHRTFHRLLAVHADRDAIVDFEVFHDGVWWRLRALSRHGASTTAWRRHKAVQSTHTQRQRLSPRRARVASLRPAAPPAAPSAVRRAPIQALRTHSGAAQHCATESARFLRAALRRSRKRSMDCRFNHAAPQADLAPRAIFTGCVKTRNPASEVTQAAALHSPRGAVKPLAAPRLLSHHGRRRRAASLQSRLRGPPYRRTRRRSSCRGVRSYAGSARAQAARAHTCRLSEESQRRPAEGH